MMNLIRVLRHRLNVRLVVGTKLNDKKNEGSLYSAYSSMNILGRKLK